MHSSYLQRMTHGSYLISCYVVMKFGLQKKMIWDSSVLYSLADFIDEDGSRIRKDESYEKNYLLGKYGAIPSLKTIDFFKEG